MLVKETSIQANFLLHSEHKYDSASNCFKHQDSSCNGRPTELAIVVPIYNPPANWTLEVAYSVDAIAQIFHDVPHCIIIVDDGSPNTLDILAVAELLRNRPTLSILSYPENRGKGFAVRYGLLHSSAKYFIYTDWDFPFGYDSLMTIYRQLTTGETSLVIGTREDEYF